MFAIKVLAEKAITSSTYNIYLLLLDMSKAFDTEAVSDGLNPLSLGTMLASGYIENLA